MILIVTDQVAGAEYILPVLKKIQDKDKENFVICCSNTSSFIWKKSGLEFHILSEIDKAKANKILIEKKPRIVILSSSSNSIIERSFILASKENKIPTIQFIDMWVNYIARFQFTDPKAPRWLQSDQTLFPDMILTLDEAAKHDMISEGIPKDIIHIVGQPNFEEKAKSLRPIENRNEIFLITQPIFCFYEKKLGYDQFDFLKLCLSALASAEISLDRIQILMHPAEDFSDYHKFMPEVMKLKISQYSEPNFNKASLIMGMFSSLLIQSVIMGITTVSVQPKANDLDQFHFSRLGLVPRFTDEQELILFLKRQTNYCINNKFLTLFDGSSDRVKNLLLSSYHMGIRQWIN